MNTMRVKYGVMCALLQAGCCTANVEPTVAPAPGAKPAAATTNSVIVFTDHGVVVPIATSRGIVAASGAKGRAAALVWLYDHRGSYALLQIDADTGKSIQRPVPFPWGGDAPFSSILSSGNKYYTHFGSHFCEYDPVSRDFTFWTNTAPRMAMDIAEDKDGVIWSATYPHSGIVSFNPKTRAFKDYGRLYPQNWAAYPSGVSVDDAGWVYWAIGNAACQILAFDPGTGIVKPLVPEEKRRPGGASVQRAANGRVYVSLGRQEGWSECLAGEIKKIEGSPPPRQAFGAGGSQGRPPMQFSDGRRLVKVDLEARVMVVEDAGTNVARTVSFEYQTQGAAIMGVEAAPDGTICGGTTFPARFFSYNPATGRLINRLALGQWNTLARQGGRFYIGAYTGGVLQEWDPSRAWVDTKAGNTNSNPLYLTDSRPHILRPHVLLAHPDGKTIVMGGTPGYGLTGGGLRFWDRETRQPRLITHTNIIPEHSTLSLAPLPGGKLLGGTTTAPGTGGIRKAEVAELYVMDMATARVEWHQAPLPGVQSYTALIPGAKGMIFGFADRRRFFVFDPMDRRVVHETDVGDTFGMTVGGQGPRIFVPGENGSIYILFNRGVAELDQKTFSISMLAEFPASIDLGGASMGRLISNENAGLDDVPVAEWLGGACLDCRIYVAFGSHLYSCGIPNRVQANGGTP